MKGLSYRDLLRELLPGEVVERLPRSYDIIGEIAVIKLPEDMMSYSRQVAEAIMKIHRNVRSVYARKSVSGVYRVAELVHIGGEDRSETIYVENGVRFYVDIKKMFVNPRMSTERLRILGRVRDGEKVLDLFAGYGAFSLSIARYRDVYIVAVDINQDAVEAMKRSLSMNRLRGSIDPVVAEASCLGESLSREYFDVVIMDNPTVIERFLYLIPRLLKRSGRAYVYILATDLRPLLEHIERLSLRVSECVVVREYSATKNIFRCEVFRESL